MTGGHGTGHGVIMRRPDGTPMTRQEVIIQRRGALKWLPVLCSNDLVHGSWWFVWGSLLTALFAIYPLCSSKITGYEHEDDLLPESDFEITWAMIIVSGVFYTFGSLAFVRAFEEPPKRALFYNFKHAQSDELLGAWMFLFGTVPFVIYMLVFFLIDPSAFYFFGMVGALIGVFCCYLFVAQCYPSDTPGKKHENIVLPLTIKLFGAHMWVVKHLANDWLAGTWIFLIGNIALTFGSFLLLLIALSVNSPQQIFNWLSGTICSFIFLIGSFYYVAGSYPHAGQFYYVTDRGQTDSSTHEIFLDEIPLTGGAGHSHSKNPLRLSVPNIAYALQNMNIFDDPHAHKLHHHHHHHHHGYTRAEHTQEAADLESASEREIGAVPSTVNPLHGGIPPVVVTVKSSSSAPVLKPHSRNDKPQKPPRKENVKDKDKTLVASSVHSSKHGTIGNVSTHSLASSVVSQSALMSAYQPLPPVVRDLNREDDDDEDEDEKQTNKNVDQRNNVSAATLVMNNLSPMK